MGHIRQQAMGNIISLLYMGTKVFFFKESIVYRYLINKGIVVYSYDQMKENIQLVHEPLHDETVSNNREILIKYWGRNINNEYTKKIINLVFARPKNY